jgi:phosphoglycolate phosphatase
MARLLKELGVDPADAVMVGDTAGDVDTGKRNSMATVGVTYGYGSREELSQADILCRTTSELMALLSSRECAP